VRAACGDFDEQFYPLYYEEVDYCYRARRAGFPVIYEPAATAIHHETVTYAARTAAYHHLMERGRIRFVLKNFPPDQLLNDFFPAELDYVQHVAADFARDVCAPAYRDVLANLPPLPPEYAATIVESLRQLRASARQVAARQPSAAHEVPMSEPLAPLDVPALREHDFQSNTPVVGPLIVKLRRVLYSLTAKWPLRVALDQQTRINQQLVQRLQQHESLLREYEARLREYDERLIDQDHDLAHLSRVTAEVELRQRHLSKIQTPPQP
jgi:hypothetical protein